MQEKLYIMSGTGIQEVDVLRQDNEDYIVKYCGIDISVDKKTMLSAFTGDRKWTTGKPNTNTYLVKTLEHMLALAKLNSETTKGIADNAVLYSRLKEAGLV